MPSIDINTGPRCPLTAATVLEEKTKGHNLVYPLAYTSRKMLIVGEALGADEDINSQYFCGKAGSLLDKLFTDVGLMRNTIHVTNVVKVRPPDNKLSRLREYNLSIEDFIPFLKEEIETIKPTVILALGATALNALCEETGILKQRGSVLECTLVPGIKVVPTLHPSYLQRGQMDLYPYVRHDIKIFAEIGFGFYTPEVEWQEIIDPTLTQCLDYLQEIIDSSTQTCLDIETVAAQKITCIGFTKNPNSSICIPFRHNGLKLRWSEAEQLILLRKMQEVFKVPKLQKIGQNIHYDLHFLLPLLGFPREPVFDTRYAHQLIHPDMRHDLGFIISAYTKMSYHKDEVKDWKSKDLPKDQVLWSYNCKDVIGTHRAAIGLIKDLKEASLYDFYCGYINPFRRVIFEMEHRGLNVDTALHKEWKDYIEQEELPIALDIINKKCGQEINPNSSKQVGEYLTSIGVLVPRTTKGNFTVKEETLQNLIAKYPEHRFILKQILCARVLKAKDLGTYLSAIISSDNHLKCSYGYTVTGRLTSQADSFNEGTNVQNFPKRMKEFIIPEPGHVFMDADLSAAEARAMAFFMDSQIMKDVLNGPLKIHYKVGEWIYDKPWQELTADEYLVAKKTVHGSNYKMGINLFSRIIGKPVHEARAIQDKYFQVVPELPKYHRDIQTEIETNRCLTNPFGRTRIFTGRIDQTAIGSGYAQKPQSTIVDMMNFGILSLYLIKPANIHLVTQTHDSVLTSLPPGLYSRWSTYVKTHLEVLRRIEINGDILNIPIEIDPPKKNWLGK